MLSFKNYIKETNIELDEMYGSVDYFLSESVANVIDSDKFQKAVALSKESSDYVNKNTIANISTILKHYGRSLYDDEPLQHLHNDLELHKERETHLKYLHHLYTTNPEEYKNTVNQAKSRLPKRTPYGQNAKTKTMAKELINGKEVVVSVSNKGVAGSVSKVGKGGTIKMRSTCVNSKQSCRGEGAEKVGATCLGMKGCYSFLSNKVRNTVLENLKTLKAPATNGDGYNYTDKFVPASPHLDYATLEYAALLNAGNKAKKLSTPNDVKLVSFRQNTQNEQSAMHHDQIIYHLPKDIAPHIATNNYSAAIAKASYDPENPSHLSTHDGILNNTNFSVKGPDVIHTDKGIILGKNPSTNLQDAKKALSPEVNGVGQTIRMPQNAYVVVGGHSDGILLKYPEKKYKQYHINNAPSTDKPFAKLRPIKTARIYTEIPYNASVNTYAHPDGHGIESHLDPVTKQLRLFEYQDYHVHANVPQPDEQGNVDFNRLNDNVGSDDRKPKGTQIRKNKFGQVVGSIHLSAATNSTPNINASGVINTNKNGEVIGDNNGLANDPFVFPIQHHIDSYNPTRINLNHPAQMMAAEVAEKQKKQVNVAFPTYELHPKTKGELGEL